MSKRSAVVTVSLVVFLAIVATAVAIVRPWAGHTDSASAPAAAMYHCPMHPTVVSVRPGSCPICGMDLVPIAGEEEHDDAVASHGGGAEVARFHCPMHPTVVSDNPGSCPICGMDLVPIATDHEAGTDVADVADLATIRMNARKRQLIGVRTAVVGKVAFARSVRAVGRVTADEKRLRQVTTKVDGYVERLHANAVGEFVRRGQPLLEIYSPELLASQNEYLVALAAKARTSGSSIASVAGFGEELVASARRRLQLFDVSDDQIDRLEATGRTERVVTIYAPISGVITARNVAQGQKIASGMPLLEVVDLSHVWALASVYEYELPFVREGQAATMTLDYVPGKTFEGTVSLVYPTVDPDTRTVQLRVEFANPEYVLKPEMFADVTLRADLGERLAVPDSAVLETGTRSIAFVETGEGVFEPREIEIGLRLHDAYEVVGGLSEGERVVVTGNFLIDSESKLKAALAGMASAGTPKSAPSGSGHAH